MSVVSIKFKLEFFDWVNITFLKFSYFQYDLLILSSEVLQCNTKI